LSVKTTAYQKMLVLIKRCGIWCG